MTDSDEDLERGPGGAERLTDPERSTDDALRGLMQKLAATPAEDEAREDLRGRRIAHYEIEDELGRGGMGVVWAARDTKLERRVALKLLPQADEEDTTRRERLVREARAAAKVAHPNVAAIFEVGEDAGRTYIAMELIDGENLGQWLRREHPLGVEAVRRVALDVSAALAAAHSAGVVHRDLKPDNVMLTPSGAAKVLDFGIARPTIEPPAGTPAPERLTAEGSLLGTLPYMSPEQALGKPCDSRSDVFSFGVMLYQLLAGERPFGGQSDAETLVQIQRDAPPSLTALRPAPHATLVAVVERCLEKQPADRYADGEALHRALTASGLDSQRRRSAARRRVAFGAAAVVVVAGLFLATQWASLVAPAGPPSFRTIPHVSDDAQVQAKMQLAAQSFYASQNDAAARLLDEVIESAPKAPGAIVLRLVAGHMQSSPTTRDGLMRRLQEAVEVADDDDDRHRQVLLLRLLHAGTRGADAGGMGADAGDIGPVVEAWLTAHPDDWFHGLLFSLMSAVEPDARVRAFDRLIAADDGPAAPYLAAAWTLQRANRGAESVAYLERGLAKNPRNLVLRRERAVRWLDAGELDLADGAMTSLLRDAPGDVFVRLASAQLRQAQGRPGDMAAQLDALLEGPYDKATAGNAVVKMAATLSQEGRVTRARVLTRRAFERLAEVGRYDTIGEHLPYLLTEELLLEREQEAAEWRALMTELLTRPELPSIVQRRVQVELLLLDRRLAVRAGDIAAAEAATQRMEGLPPTHFSAREPQERAVLLARAGDLALRRDRDALKLWSDAYPEETHTGVRAQWTRAKMAALIGDDDLLDDSLAIIRAQRDDCLARELWWESVCRVYLVAASVRAAERARERGDEARAVVLADEALALWPKADADTSWVRRAHRARGDGEPVLTPIDDPARR